MTNKVKEYKLGLFAGIRNRIIAGVVIIIPIGVTIWFGYFVFTYLTEWSISLIKTNYHSFLFDDTEKKIVWAWWAVRSISILLILSVLFIIGALAQYTLGKKLISLADIIMRRVPMLNTFYLTARQIWDAIWSTKNGMFNKVVMFEYPRKGIWVIGFLTNENEVEGWEPHEKSGEDLVSIFLPTTPNPTSGFLLFVPRKDCKFLDMDVAEGMRLVISGGAIASPNHNGNGKKNDTAI